MRIFLAVALHQRFSNIFEQIVRELKPQFPNFKWVTPEQFHLTLHFFGEIPPQTAEEFSKRFRLKIYRTGELELSLQRLGLFPEQGMPRVLWIGITGDAEKLQRIQQQAAESAGEVGVPGEDRTFMPHATIARIKSLSPEERTRLKTLSGSFQISAPKIKFNEIYLYESKLTPEGPEHRVREVFSL